MRLAIGFERLKGELGQGFSVKVGQLRTPLHDRVEVLQAEVGKQSGDLAASCR